MTKIRLAAIASTLCFIFVTGCSSNRQSRDVSGDVRRSLDQAGLKDVSVSQDRDKGVVTLTGHVAGDADKQRAESIAKSAAPEQVVANEIAVNPPGPDNNDKVQSSLDDGIQNNLDAALQQSNLKRDVSYSVKNGVVTLKGDVNSAQVRSKAAEVAQSVPNVKQVVNELQVKNQKATSNK
jgi:hyperosmotically inducible protein